LLEEEVENIRDTIGGGAPPASYTFEDPIPPARATLGDEAVDRLIEEGRAMGVPAGEPRSFPKHEQLESKALAVLRTGRANASVPNRIQALVLGFFVAVWVSLVLIVATAPDIFDRALRLGPGQHTIADATFLAAISAFLVVLSIGVVRRWAWTFWLILVAFLTGILRIPLAALELTDVISTSDPPGMWPFRERSERCSLGSDWRCWPPFAPPASRGARPRFQGDVQARWCPAPDGPCMAPCPCRR
jgi:hypothetical protein